MKNLHGPGVVSVNTSIVGPDGSLWRAFYARTWRFLSPDELGELVPTLRDATPQRPYAVATDEPTNESKEVAIRLVIPGENIAAFLLADACPSGPGCYDLSGGSR